MLFLSAVHLTLDFTRKKGHLSRHLTAAAAAAVALNIQIFSIDSRKLLDPSCKLKPGIFLYAKFCEGKTAAAANSLVINTTTTTSYPPTVYHYPHYYCKKKSHFSTERNVVISRNNLPNLVLIAFSNGSSMYASIYLLNISDYMRMFLHPHPSFNKAY